MRQPLLSFTFLATATFALAGDFVYHQPAKEIADALAARPTPKASVSPQRDYVLFMQPVRYPPIAEIAQPMLRLAGGRIDVNTVTIYLAKWKMLG